MYSDPKILGLAFIGGIIPSLLWLWFWLREDRANPEPKLVLTTTFIMGMAAVILVLQVQRFIKTNVDSENLQLVLWASAEEVVKYLAVLIVIFRTSYAKDPIDWPIYLITSALGFAALENALFLIKPLSVGQDTIGLLTGQLRFLGSTLLHTVSSGILGIALGISLNMSGFKRVWHFLVGMILAITLHSVFNFFIIRVNEGGEGSLLEILRVFGFLWVAAIIVMLLFEKVRRIN